MPFAPGNTLPLRHGHTSNNTKSPEYQSWANMKDRCLNPNSTAFYCYGGRGIKICERWVIFENFLADMGPRPSLKYSLDRHPNNDGDYEPENCRWATINEQLANRSNSLKIKINGQSIPNKQFCQQTG